LICFLVYMCVFPWGVCVYTLQAPQSNEYKHVSAMSLMWGDRMGVEKGRFEFEMETKRTNELLAEILFEIKRMHETLYGIKGLIQDLKYTK